MADRQKKERIVYDLEFETSYPDEILKYRWTVRNFSLIPTNETINLPKHESYGVVFWNAFFYKDDSEVVFVTNPVKSVASRVMAKVFDAKDNRICSGDDWISGQEKFVFRWGNHHFRDLPHDTLVFRWEITSSENKLDTQVVGRKKE